MKQLARTRTHTKAVLGMLVVLAIVAGVELVRRGEAPWSGLQVQSEEPEAPSDLHSVREGRMAASSSASRKFGGIEDSSDLGSAIIAIHHVSLGRSIVGSRWRFVSVHDSRGSAFERSLELDESGEIEIEAGSWMVTSETPGMAPLHSACDVKPGERYELWVDSSYDLRVRVVDDLGNPIAGADVGWTQNRQWHARAPNRRYFEDRPLDASARTDEQGYASLLLNHMVGTCHIFAEGFIGATRQLDVPIRSEMTIVLLPLPSTSVEVQFVDALTLVPLSGLRLVTYQGIQIGSSNEAGFLAIDPAILHSGSALVRGPGVCAMILPTSCLSAGASIRIPRAKEIRVTLRSEGGVPVPKGRIICYSATDGWGCKGARILFDSEATTGRDGAVNLKLPRDFPCTLLAIAPTGESVEVQLTPSSVSGELELVLGEPRNALELRVRGAGGEAVKNTWALVNYEGSGLLTIRDGPGGRLVIPIADRVRNFSVHGDGAPRYFRLAKPVLDPRDGFLDVTLPSTSSVQLRLIDSAGKPVRGVFVGFDSPELRNNLHEYPGYGGGRPTEHAAWIESPYTWFGGTTGANGVLKVGDVPEGTYRARLSTNPILSGEFQAQRLYSPQSFEFRVPSEAAMTYVIPAPRHVMLAVNDGYTGKPVGGFRVFATWGLPGATYSVIGNFWNGWIPANESVLHIESEGIGSAAVVLDSTRGPGAIQEVALFSEGYGKVIVVGLEGLEYTGDFEIVATRGDGQGGEWQVWESHLSLDENGSAPLSIPHTNVQVSVSPITVGGRTFRFEPNSVQWHAGNEVLFRAVPIR